MGQVPHGRINARTCTPDISMFHHRLKVTLVAFVAEFRQGCCIGQYDVIMGHLATSIKREDHGQDTPKYTRPHETTQLRWLDDNTSTLTTSLSADKQLLSYLQTRGVFN